MRRNLFPGLLAAAMLLALASCGFQGTSPGPDPTPTETPIPAAENTPIPEEATPAEDAPLQAGKVLVAYFSATGNTRPLAQAISDSLGADLYEIIPETPYTQDDLNYHNDDCRANQEQNDDAARPAISGSVENMQDYDVIFLGYPIWWGKAPKIIHTFLESYELDGITIIPFCTSASSGYDDSTIRPLAPDAVWQTGQRFSGGASRSTVESWVNSLGLFLTPAD